MALTLRSSGVAGGLVTTDWWNDYYKLFRGTMTDQPVKIANSLTMVVPWAAPANCAVGASVGSGLGTGLYVYMYTQVNADGAESTVSGQVSCSTSGGNLQVTISSISTGPAGCGSRNLYRSKVGGGTLYFLHTINDNTTTSYVDSTPDGSLTVQAPNDTAIGGVQFVDVNGFNQGWITSSSGRIGLVSLHNFTWYVPSGNEMMYLDNVNFDLYTGNIRFQKTAASNNCYISLPSGANLGVKAGGTRLFEVKNNGNLTISGAQYQTTGGAIATVTGQTFDAFDVGEVFECDATYPNGTVVCPGPNSKMTLCTHDNCHAASVISYNPGLGLGANDHENGVHYIALAGRVNVRTAADILPRQLVVSNGRGGVRPVNYEEPAFVMGVALNSTCEEGDMKGTVGILLRSMFVILKKPV